MTLHDEFSAAFEQRAEQIRADRASNLDKAEKKQAQTTAGSAWLQKQFDLLDAAGESEPPLPTATPDDADIFSILPKF